MMLKKNNDPDFRPKSGNKKVSVGAGGEAYGVTIDGNAKSAQKTMTRIQPISNKSTFHSLTGQNNSHTIDS